MHKKKLLCHRDLKPENFLIDSDFNILLADFGFCGEILTLDQTRKSVVGNNGSQRTKTHYSIKGTLSYLAPEILTLTAKGYNPEQTDVFSLGVILFTMILGKPPFRQASPDKDELYSMLVELKYSKFWNVWHDQYASQVGIELTPHFKQLFLSLVCHDPQQRLSISELRNHPWLWNAR